MTVQDIDNSHAIWGKNIAVFKGNTTMKKLIHVAGDLMKVPRELIKLHKGVFMTAYFTCKRNTIFNLDQSQDCFHSSEPSNWQEIRHYI